MGDRCYLKVVCRKADKKAFEELGLVAHAEGEDTPEGFVRMFAEEANYACWDDLCTLAADGLKFSGWHDAGDEYPGAWFATSETDELTSVDVTRGGPCVNVDYVDGKVHVDKGDAKRALAYFKANEALKKAWGFEGA